MAYDEVLADRVREALSDRQELSEREIFGGIAFMLAGNMACGVIGEELMIRLGDEDAAKALEGPHTRPMDFTGKPMKTTVYVDSAGTASDSDLAGWVGAGADFAAGLPAK